MKKKSPIFRRLFGYLLKGLLVVAPAALTAYIIWGLFAFIDDSVNDAIEGVFDIRIRGLGFLLGTVLIILIGMLSGSLFKQLFLWIEEGISHIPVVKIVYSSIKDFFSAFVSEDRKFNKPALIKMGGNENLQRLGFITETDLSHLGIDGMVAVYIPHSYNFSGNLFIVKMEDVTPIEANTADIMKFIVSGGVTKFEH
ncbi:hypothetical protein BH09BAC1_BH09BAC1_20200 [soil metagenome]